MPARSRHLGNRQEGVTEMEKGKYCVSSPKITIKAVDENDPWNADWEIFLNKEDVKIGKLNFAGEKALGTVPLYMELEKQYRNKGYGTEAAIMIVDWLFHFPNVYEVSCEVDRENDKGVKALRKAGFVNRDGEGGGRMVHYSITKQKTSWTGLYLFLGIAIGLVLGIILQHAIAGMIAGVVIGVSIGLSLDVKANKAREKITGKHLK